MMIQAVVFDLDGVIINTEETWSRVRAEFVARHGGHWTEQDQRNVMGDNSRQWSAYIKNTWNLLLPEEQIYQQVVQAMIVTYRGHLEVLPGAREAITALGAAYPLAVASSSPAELIGVALEVVGVADRFRAVVSSDQVAHGKPSPDVYLLAAERLGVPPERCAAIEDSTNGLRAAVAAGMATIAVPNSAYPPAADALTGVRLVLGNLHALTPQMIAGLDRA